LGSECTLHHPFSLFFAPVVYQQSRGFNLTAEMMSLETIRVDLSEPARAG
jgi:hypothetical protein